MITPVITPRLNNEQIMQIQNMTNIHMKLYQHFYTEENKQNLILALQNNLEIFSAEVEGNSILIKIKKTTIKKITGYSHDSLFYYTLIDQIMFNWIQQVLATTPTSLPRETVENMIMSINQTNVNLLYRVDILTDNMISITI